MQRIDKVVRGPGLIRSAKTYSLFLDKDILYTIVTGPAQMNVGTLATFGMVAGAVTSAVKKPAENFFANKYAPKIAEGEAAIEVAKLPELAGIKHNFAIPFGSMSEIVVGTHPVQGPFLKLNTSKEKLEFYFRDKTQAEVETLAKSFGQAVTVK